MVSAGCGTCTSTSLQKSACNSLSSAESNLTEELAKLSSSVVGRGTSVTSPALDDAVLLTFFARRNVPVGEPEGFGCFKPAVADRCAILVGVFEGDKLASDLVNCTTPSDGEHLVSVVVAVSSVSVAADRTTCHRFLTYLRFPFVHSYRCHGASA